MVTWMWIYELPSEANAQLQSMSHQMGWTIYCKSELSYLSHIPWKQDYNVVLLLDYWIIYLFRRWSPPQDKVWEIDPPAGRVKLKEASGRPAIKLGQAMASLSIHSGFDCSAWCYYVYIYSNDVCWGTKSAQLKRWFNCFMTSKIKPVRNLFNNVLRPCESKGRHLEGAMSLCVCLRATHKLMNRRCSEISMRTLPISQGYKLEMSIRFNLLGLAEISFSNNISDSGQCSFSYLLGLVCLNIVKTGEFKFSTRFFFLSAILGEIVHSEIATKSLFLFLQVFVYVCNLWEWPSTWQTADASGSLSGNWAANDVHRKTHCLTHYACSCRLCNHDQ